MRLVHRLTAGYLAVVVLIAGLGYFAVTTIKTSLRQSIGQSCIALGVQALEQIDRQFHSRIEGIQVYARSSLLQARVADSNRRFEALPDASAYILDAERQWTEPGEEAGSALMASIMANDLSRELANQVEFYRAKYGFPVVGELFVTNRFGANVAQSGPTTDYRQDDEPWWQQAREHGSYVGDVSYDESAGVYSTDVAVRVDDNSGAFSGVLKVVLNIGDAIGIVEELRARAQPADGPHVAYYLLTADARVIYSTEGLAILQEATELRPALAGIRPGEGRAVQRTDPEQGELLSVQARSGGHRDFEGLGWVLVIEQKAADVFAPVRALKHRMLIVALLVGLVALALGVTVSLSLSARLGKLRSGMESVAAGDLQHKVGIQGNDEIGWLSHAFDAMTEDLRRTTVSRDALLAEVERRELAERQLRDALHNLERSNAELEQFAYVASHDLQEPLRKVIAFGDRLEAKYGDLLSEEGQDYLGRMRGAAQRMSQLIGDLLTVSRVTTQGRPFVSVDLQEILRGVLGDLELRIRDVDAEIEVAPLPTLEADPTQMRQLFQNLISNALKFRKEGTRPVVAVQSRLVRNPDGNDICEIGVEDNGIGFDEKYLERVFKVFQRLHTRAEYSGTGIGLAICRRIVERHGGTITARSVPGRGSRFIVTLPLRHAAAEEDGSDAVNHHSDC